MRELGEVIEASERIVFFGGAGVSTESGIPDFRSGGGLYSRETGANWFLLDFAERARLMAEHGESGMKFGGKVTQMVTGAVGLDDWEWGVTLWARNPELLKEIVYRMRFDEASAKYGQFGPFYLGYLQTAAEILAHCRVTG